MEDDLSSPFDLHEFIAGIVYLAALVHVYVLKEGQIIKAWIFRDMDRSVAGRATRELVVSIASGLPETAKCAYSPESHCLEACGSPRAAAPRSQTLRSREHSSITYAIGSPGRDAESAKARKRESAKARKRDRYRLRLHFLP